MTARTFAYYKYNQRSQIFDSAETFDTGSHARRNNSQMNKANCIEFDGSWTERPRSATPVKPRRTEVTPTRPRKTTVEEFVITGLRPSDDDYALRQLCNGLHVTKLKTNVNEINGSCKGDAVIQIRNNPDRQSVDKLKLSMAACGYKVGQAKSFGRVFA